MILKTKVVDSYYFSVDQLNSRELCYYNLGISNSNAYRDQEEDTCM